MILSLLKSLPLVVKWSDVAGVSSGLQQWKFSIRGLAAIECSGKGWKNGEAYQRRTGPSLHCGLNAPPAASQAFVPGVASAGQTML